MWIAGAVILAGSLITVLHRVLGIAFCRLGKVIHRSSALPIRFDEETLAECYPEDKMPRYVMIAGIVTIVGGGILLGLSILVEGSS